ncbi:MAG: IclR family transcriptional regulator [Desulfuromusa sp.]|nr:IclR family transcriptional regulator [Desulfuromusa sp.]
MTLSIDKKDFVMSLDRGLKVIQAFDREHEKMSLSQVAMRVELNRAAVRRFLLTLKSLGYVNSDGKLFWLSPKILKLGYSYLVSQPIVDLVQPFVDLVSAEVGESCSVSVLDGTEIVYISRRRTQRIMSFSLHVGTRLPAAVTSMGRVILANKNTRELDTILDLVELKQLTKYTMTDRQILKEELLKVREQGYSVINEELELGLRSIAVPIHNKNDKIVAAINVGTHAERISEQELIDRILPCLLKSAMEIREILPL